METRYLAQQTPSRRSTSATLKWKTESRHPRQGNSRRDPREDRRTAKGRVGGGTALEQTRDLVDSVYRSDSRRVFATLIRLLGDFDTAEDAMHDAFAAALEQWPRDGVPANPRAWLVSAGRFRAIDGMRRAARFDASLPLLAERLDINTSDNWADDTVEDDRLRLILTCCHPILSPEARIALTLREVCELTTDEIARAFLMGTPAVAQRIVRAKAKIRDAGVPYEVPSPSDLPNRLESVLQVIYLVFSEGYSASSGDSLIRADLSSEAIRLGRLLYHLLPEPETAGLLALMLLTDSRRSARTAPNGDLIPLKDQNRSLWDRAQIAEGQALVKEALATRRFGPYTIQATIAAVHAEADSAENTDWPQIVALYGIFYQMAPSPVVALNRAVAVAMQSGAAAGIVLIDAILAGGDLTDYHRAHAARAELCSQLGRIAEARVSYERALELVCQEPERRYLSHRLANLDS